MMKSYSPYILFTSGGRILLADWVISNDVWVNSNVSYSSVKQYSIYCVSVRKTLYTDAIRDFTQNEA